MGGTGTLSSTERMAAVVSGEVITDAQSLEKSINKLDRSFDELSQEKKKELLDTLLKLREKIDTTIDRLEA